MFMENSSTRVLLKADELFPCKTVYNSADARLQLLYMCSRRLGKKKKLALRVTNSETRPTLGGNPKGSLSKIDPCIDE